MCSAVRRRVSCNYYDIDVIRQTSYVLAPLTSAPRHLVERLSYRTDPPSRRSSWMSRAGKGYHELPGVLCLSKIYRKEVANCCRLCCCCLWRWRMTAEMQVRGGGSSVVVLTACLQAELRAAALPWPVSSVATLHPCFWQLRQVLLSSAIHTVYITPKTD